MAAALPTAYSQFSAAEILRGVQISTAVVQEKQHRIFCSLIQLVFPCVECHECFESLATVSHQKAGFFPADATELRRCLPLQYTAEGRMLR